MKQYLGHLGSFDLSSWQLSQLKHSDARRRIKTKYRLPCCLNKDRTRFKVLGTILTWVTNYYLEKNCQRTTPASSTEPAFVTSKGDGPTFHPPPPKKNKARPPYQSPLSSALSDPSSRMLFGAILRLVHSRSKTGELRSSAYIGEELVQHALHAFRQALGKLLIRTLRHSM